MPHFLIKKEEIKDNLIELQDKDNYFHLARVLRIKIGEKVKFIDIDGTVYNTKVKEITKNSLTAEIIEKNQSKRKLEVDLNLIQSILMSDAQNLAVANAVQSGIKTIYPVISDNVANGSQKNKIEKWEKIAYENFKQCERADLAEIHPVLPLKEALLKFPKENVLIFAERFENSNLNTCLKSCDMSKKIAVVIGPEGGFSEAEFDFFKKEGYKLITLGKMIYKAPNAITAAISNVVSRIENDI